jgi:hypothetical protein
MLTGESPVVVKVGHPTVLLYQGWRRKALEKARKQGILIDLK